MTRLLALLLLPVLAQAASITLKQVDTVTTAAVAGQSTQLDVNWTDATNGGGSIGYIVEQCPPLLAPAYCSSTGTPGCIIIPACTAPNAVFVVIGRVVAGAPKTFRAMGLTPGTQYTFHVYEDPSLSATGTPTTTTTTTSTTTFTTTTTSTTTSTTTTTTSTSTTTTHTTTTTTVTTTTTTVSTTTGTGPTTTSTTTTTLTTTTTTTSTTTTTTSSTTTSSTTTTSTTTSTTTTTMVGNNPTLIGFVPGVGSATDVVADQSNPRVYAGSASFGLAVVNVTTPSAMTGLGASNPSFVGGTIAVSGTRGVSANGVNGFATVDLTNPAAPLTKATIAGTFRAVTIAGPTAYAIQSISGNPGHTDLAVVDVTNLGSPSIVGRVTVPGGAGVKVAGMFAYVATGGGLQIVNVSTPSAPTLAGFVATSTSQQQSGEPLCLSGNTAYAAEDPNGVRIYNVSNPASPGLLTTIATPSRATAVSGTRLYVVTAATLKIYDVSNSTAPVLLGSGTSPDGASFVAVDVKGTTAYTANANTNPVTGAGGVYAWDVSNSASPTILGHFSGLADDWGVAQSGTLAVQTQNALGLKVVDTTNLAVPKIVGSLTGVMHEVAMAGTKAYATNFVPGNPGHTDLIVVDLVVPSSPAIVGRVTLPGGSSGIALNGTLAYVAGGGNLVVVDVSTPSNPQIVNTLVVGGTTGGLAINGNRLYLGNGTFVRAYDLSTPSLPALLGSLSMASGQALALAVSGTNLAVVDFLTLRLVDASVPSAMVLRSSTALTTTAGVAFDSTSRVFVVENQKVIVYNATNLAAPVLQKTITLAGATTGQISGGNEVAIGNNVFIGDSAATVDILQVTF